MLKQIAVALALTLAAMPAAHADDTPAPHEMAVTANPHASKAALAMMKQGGSAVDAAIAAQMVLTLVEPESSGIGGGAFMVLYDPAHARVTSFDGREMAPASATPGMFLDSNGKPRKHFDAIPGGLSVGVPGDVAMLWKAHQEYGRLPWKTLFAPAIALAQNGFPVGHKLAKTIVDNAAMARMPDIKAYFYHPDGTPYAQGEILKNPALAQTLRAIADNGPKAFYSGAIAQAIVDKVRHAPVNPGGMTLADLANYRAVERKPVCGFYRAYQLCSMGPPSSGGVAILQMLGMLQHFPSGDLKPDTLGEVELFTQASRLAFADRMKYLGDPEVVHVPVAGLLNKNYLAQRAALIDPKKDMGKALAGTPPTTGPSTDYAPQVSKQLPGTSQLSIVDSRGEAISMTTTVEYIFGSETMADGFILNNQLTDFSFQPVRDGKPVANAPAPGKRPMSAMSPTIVFGPDGKFFAATGSPGGPIIIDYVAQSLVDLIDGHMTPQQAAADPHISNPNGPTILEADTPIDGLEPQLEAMGHKVVLHALESGLNIVEATPKGYIGGSDPRRDGVAMGD